MFLKTATKRLYAISKVHLSLIFPQVVISFVTLYDKGKIPKKNII